MKHIGDVMDVYFLCAYFDWGIALDFFVTSFFLPNKSTRNFVTFLLRFTLGIDARFGKL